MTDEPPSRLTLPALASQCRADTELAKHLADLAREALDVLEEILILPTTPQNINAKLAAAQTVINTQVRVDDQMLRTQEVVQARADIFEAFARIRAENPQLYRGRSGEEEK